MKSGSEGGITSALKLGHSPLPLRKSIPTTQPAHFNFKRWERRGILPLFHCLVTDVEMDICTSYLHISGFTWSPKYFNLVNLHTLSEHETFVCAPEENQPKRRVLAKFTTRSTLGGGYGLVAEGGRLTRTADSALYETFLTSADAMRSSQSRSEECKLGEKWGRGEGRQKGVESWRIVHPLIFAT